MNYTGRIDGFQIRDVTYIGLPPKSTPPQYDIVKFSIDKKDGLPGFGDLVWDSKEPCFDFKSVGLRWLEANPTQAVIDMVLKFAEEKEMELENDD